jgi:hypothetical protein
MNGMQDPEAVDRYFTEQVVGQAFMVEMGPTATAKTLSPHGVLVQWLGGKASLTGMAARSLWANEAAGVLHGQPVNLPELLHWRRRALLIAWGLWSLLLSGVFLWWRS